jgi:hypothetical protein
VTINNTVDYCVLGYNGMWFGTQEGQDIRLSHGMRKGGQGLGLKALRSSDSH